MEVTGNTGIIGVIGNPIEHTLSPAMHNAAFASLGLDYVYLPFRVSSRDLAASLDGVRALGFIGINVTVPHKEAVLPLLDEVAPEAKVIGAVNTIHNDRGRLVGHNTDGHGFVNSLRETGCCDPAGKTVTILGTGGGARAVAVQLALTGVDSLHILGRRLERAEALKAALSKGVPGCRVTTGLLREEGLPEIINRSQVLVNATTVGMYPRHDAQPLVGRDMFHRDLVVCDLVYNPARTRLLEEAQAAGCRTMAGLEMLVRQGALAFRIWTGREAPVGMMKAILKEKLAV